ncbi:MAG: cell division protein FtsH, partial [Candidatus Neomarinimicrobiota bacterium]
MKKSQNNTNHEKNEKDKQSAPGQSGKPPVHRKTDKLGNDFKWKKASKTSFMWLVIIVSSILLLQVLGKSGDEEVVTTYSQYKEFLTTKMIKEATIIDKEFHGVLTEKKALTVGQRIMNADKFMITLPFVDDTILKEWDAVGLKYNFKEKSGDWSSFLINLLPFILFFGVWLFFIRRMQGQNNKGLFGFGKSKARLWTSDR